MQSASNGVQRAPNQQSTTNCHLGYRMMIDGVAKGDATWGQRIQVSNGATSWHQTWSLVDFNTLDVETHTIAVQTNQLLDSTTSQCMVCAENGGQLTAYDSCTLNVMAILQ